MSAQSTAVNKYRKLLRHCLRRPHDKAAITLLTRLAAPLNERVPENKLVFLRGVIDGAWLRKRAARRYRQLRNRHERARALEEQRAQWVV